MTSRPAAPGRPRTVLHLIATNFHGGPEKQIVNHLARLDRGRYRGLLASFLEGGRENETLAIAERSGIAVAGIAMSGAFDPRVLRSLARLIARERVDAVCAHGYKALVLGYLAARRAGVPILAFSRGYTAENARVAFYEWLDRRVLGRVDGVVCVSAGQAEKLKALGVACRRSWVVHNAISLPGRTTGDRERIRREYDREFALPGGAKLVVAAGRLSPEKGHRFLVEAIPLLGPGFEDAFFVFCGDGPCCRQLEDQARSLGVADRCRFVGFRRDVETLFAAMDLMALPSLTEGLPNVVLEAFAQGRPVVATAVGGVPEVVDGGTSGLLVPAADPSALARAVAAVLSLPDRGASLGGAGFKRVQRDFTFERQNSLLEGIYDEVFARGSVAPR